MVVMVCIPMVIFTSGLNHARITLLLLVNVFLRLMLPSAYFPATASKSGALAHPLTARLVAFVAEFGLYEVWAEWAGVGFWSLSTWLWALVLLGEVTSTIGVLLQSEAILNVEDTIWALHTTYMCWLCIPNHPMGVAFFGAFASFMWFVHLPRRFDLFFRRARQPTATLGKPQSPWTHIEPLWSGAPTPIQRCAFEEMSWVVPMLMAQPPLTAWMYYHMA